MIPIRFFILFLILRGIVRIISFFFRALWMMLVFCVGLIRSVFQRSGEDIFRIEGRDTQGIVLQCSGCNTEFSHSHACPNCGQLEPIASTMFAVRQLRRTFRQSPALVVLVGSMLFFLLIWILI